MSNHRRGTTALFHFVPAPKLDARHGMDPRLKALHKRKLALQAEQKAILAKDTAQRSAEESERLTAILGARNAESGDYEGGELAAVNADIAEYERASALELAQAHRDAVARSDNPSNQHRAGARHPERRAVGPRRRAAHGGLLRSRDQRERPQQGRRSALAAPGRRQRLRLQRRRTGRVPRPEGILHAPDGAGGGGEPVPLA